MAPAVLPETPFHGSEVRLLRIRGTLSKGWASVLDGSAMLPETLPEMLPETLPETLPVMLPRARFEGSAVSLKASPGSVASQNEKDAKIAQF